MDYLILVNKDNNLCINYVPNDLVSCEGTKKETLCKEAYKKFLLLKKDALKNDYDFYINSGFRSGQIQQKVFNHYFIKNFNELKGNFPFDDDERLKREAYIMTTKRVALPGQSEHQTGLAIDIECYYKGNYDEDIADLGEIDWMRDNAHKYGFILRYPEGKAIITGYNYEPWHYRYIGEEYAYDLTKRNITFEEYHKLVLKKH